MKKENYLDYFVLKERNKEFIVLSLISLINIQYTIITIIVQV